MEKQITNYNKTNKLYWYSEFMLTRFNKKEFLKIKHLKHITVLFLESYKNSLLRNIVTVTFLMEK